MNKNIMQLQSFLTYVVLQIIHNFKINQLFIKIYTVPSCTPSTSLSKKIIFIIFKKGVVKIAKSFFQWPVICFIRIKGHA